LSENQTRLIRKMHLIWLNPEICSDPGLLDPDLAALSLPYPACSSLIRYYQPWQLMILYHRAAPGKRN
jgi:hypothetical protein